MVIFTQQMSKELLITSFLHINEGIVFIARHTLYVPSYKRLARSNVYKHNYRSLYTSSGNLMTHTLTTFGCDNCDPDHHHIVTDFELK